MRLQCNGDDMSADEQQSKSAEPLMVIPDCNVLFHAKALTHLPWKELGAKVIEIVLVPTVIREVDGLKQKPGRIGKLARQYNTHFRELMKRPDRATRLSDAPKVSWRLDFVRRTKAARDSIDLGHADDTILNDVITLQDEGKNVIFLTNDTIACANAQSHGIRCVLLPDHWQRDPEPDPSTKALRLAEAEILRLTSISPRPEIKFLDDQGQPLTALHVSFPIYPKLSSEQIDSLVDRLLAVAPLKDVSPGGGEIAPAGPSGSWIDTVKPVTAAEIIVYRKRHGQWIREARDKLVRLHRELGHFRRGPIFTLCLSNVGGGPAINTLVELAAHGGFSVVRPADPSATIEIENARRVALDTLPPPPSVPKPMRLMRGEGGEDLFARLPAYPNIKHPRPPRSADTFIWRKKRGESAERMAIDCQNWRHQREADLISLELALPEWERDWRGLLAVRVNADNIIAPVEAKLPIEVKFDRVDVAKIAEKMVAHIERGATR
jgi:hypothetical protein